jgi:hypothetical protein
MSRAFDLRQHSDYLRSFNRWGRVIFLGIGAGLFAESLALQAPTGFSQARSLLAGGPTPTNVAVLVIELVWGPVVLVLMAWVSFIWLAPGPESMLVDDAGIEFVYRNARHQVLRWDDPKLAFRLRDSRGNPAGSRLMDTEIWLKRRVPFPIPTDALEVIRRTAIAHGLSVKETWRSPSPPGKLPGYIAYRVSHPS